MPQDFLCSEDGDGSDIGIDRADSPIAPISVGIMTQNIRSVIPVVQEANSSTATIDDEDDDSDAPEDISFATSKATVLQELRDQRESVKQQKEKAKDKRRKRQELLIAQKEKKKQRLNELFAAKLPDDVLQNLAANESTSNGSGPDEDTSAANELEGSIGEPTEIGRKLMEMAKKSFSPLDIVPVSSKSTEFHVQVLDGKVNSVAARVKNLSRLKDDLIFRRKKREPNRQAVAKVAKQAAAGLNKIVVSERLQRK